ncbi:MmgE/PrpD family protein [Peribacillus sp. NPDC046944]|uniref:MmgE/PrpD family protein n=1 Tax=unclassified Peribacillus TaxID=2675266 RepID=UPI003D02B860
MSNKIVGTPVQVTHEFAKFIHDFHPVQLDQTVKKQVHHILTDYFCAAITGSQTETSKRVLHYLIESEGTGKSNVIGSKHRLSPANAAFINGTSAHCLDFDDGHTHGSVHPAAPIIPAVLAIAESLQSEKDELLKAIVIGYEVCLRISAAIHPNSRKRGFHNTPITGIFGATAAVCYLHKMDVEEIQNAFGIAGSFAGGLFAFLGTGSEVKRIHPGQAARDGIHAALLSLHGLTGPTNVLEGTNGFFEAFAGDINNERLFANLGTQYEIFNIYFKPYPCCRHLHVAIDVINEMKKIFSIDVEEIRAIKIGVNEIAAMHHHKECTNLLDAQMSMPYAVALACLHDELHVDLFQPSHAPEEVWELAKKIDVYVDEKANELYPEYRAAKVDMVMNNGEEWSHFIDNPLGEPSKPLTTEQLQTKFTSNCNPIIGVKPSQVFLKGLSSEKNTDVFYQI